MKKNIPLKADRIISPEKKAEFFNGLAIYISEYKQKMLRKKGNIPASKAS